MKLCDELRDEHRLIERVAGAFVTWADRRAAGEPLPDEAPRFLRFFALWAGDWHHGREEDVLFDALVTQAELPRETGPIAALTGQHHSMADTLRRARALAESGADDAGTRTALASEVRAYVHALWAHIDAEDSVLLPESAQRLGRMNVPELTSRGPTDAELAARDDGEALAARYPMPADAQALRGEQCVVCPSFGTTCRGVELEWWTEHEWDDFFDRVG